MGVEYGWVTTRLLCGKMVGLAIGGELRMRGAVERSIVSRPSSFGMLLVLVSQEVRGMGTGGWELRAACRLLTPSWVSHARSC